jgi:hypothetical protein
LASGSNAPRPAALLKGAIMASVTVETGASEIFFSIFFVTVVRSFAEFKDMAIAS